MRATTNMPRQAPSSGTRARAAAVMIALALVVAVPGVSGAFPLDVAKEARHHLMSAQPNPATGQVTAHDRQFWLGTNVIDLRGVFMPVEGPTTRFTQAASWGMNLVRFQFEWTKLEPTPPVHNLDGTWTHTYSATYLLLLEQQIASAQAAGLYVVVGNYWDQGTFFRWPDWLYQSAYNSHGITYAQTPDGYTQAETDFWSDPLRQQFMVSMLSYLAGQLAPVQGIAGYEVLNEPMWGTLTQNHSTTQTIVDWEVTAAQALRAADPARIVFFMARGGEDGGLTPADLSGFVALGNVGVDVHDYFGARWGDGMNEDPTSPVYLESAEDLFAHTSTLGQIDPPYFGSEASQKRRIQNVMDAVATEGFPVMVGEFGADPTDPGVAAFFGTTTAAFNELAVSWAVNYTGGNGIVDTNDGQHPYPYASIVIAAATAPTGG